MSLFFTRTKNEIDYIKIKTYLNLILIEVQSNVNARYITTQTFWLLKTSQAYCWSLISLVAIWFIRYSISDNVDIITLKTFI